MLEQLKKFPFGFIVCCLTFTFERLAYYGGKWGIAIFVVLEAAQGGLGLTTEQGAIFSSQFVAWTYITPIIGGFIADRWVSPRLLVPLGEILMAAGWFAISRAQGAGGVWLAIILLAVGTGFFKGNVSGINGRQFANDKDTLTTAFSIQYMFVNIGSFVGTTFLALIGTQGAGYRAMFMACAIFMLIDAAWWLFGMKYLGDAGKKPFLIDNRTEDVNDADVAKDKRPLTKLEKNRVIAILILTFLSGLFWLFWYLLYMPVYYEFGPASQGGMGWANCKLRDAYSLVRLNERTALHHSRTYTCCSMEQPQQEGQGPINDDQDSSWYHAPRTRCSYDGTRRWNLQQHRKACWRMDHHHDSYLDVCW